MAALAKGTPMPNMPTTEQEQRAKWDLMLLDIEARTEQLRQMKTFPAGTYEGWKLMVAATSATAAVFIAGAAVGGLLAHVLIR
jgi:hypothetical protein